MSRKKYGLTEYRIQKFLREGRGLGSGAFYKPWTTVSDLSSKGRSHRVYWWKTGRVHHLLSDIEFLVFLHLIWEVWDEVVEVEDIREQYPLRREETIRIAKELGVKHPTDPHFQTVWVVTTDFLVTMSTPQGVDFAAFAAKPDESLENISVQSKLEIERRYWEERHIRWYEVVESQVKTPIGRNLWWIFDGSDNPFQIEDLHRTVFSLLAIQRCAHPYIPIRDVCKFIDDQLSCPRGSSLGFLRQLLARKWIRVDLNAAYIQDLPMSAFNFTEGAKI
ncbi:TnsA endonuclease N-terminal domain-containing protein [Geomonas edaphica]|uniref:TnsA endonuclease N-terminal domain-containing protein n=1 Tax=Geomonas edaphica TaxID=2570226 RepID=UPI0010A8C7EC|nr:TnsA endonuclease N-terminal domain-containing protein [Geomonas edaphica]